MEPKLPAPNIGPEQAPASFDQNVERTPVLPTPERMAEQGRERLEQKAETATTEAVPVLPPPVISSAPPSDDTNAATVAADDTPLVANDDDLIEKEWVDKAKKIIVQTKDDPYMREQEVSKLQADYLKKRYGKELGAS